MYLFSVRSKKNYDQLHKDLQLILDEAIKIMDFAITTGHRNKVDQDEAFAKKVSKKKFPESKHNVYPSHAVDIHPYPIDYEDLSRYYYLAGIMKGIALSKGVKIRWGGDWDSDNDFKDQFFNDLGHFEKMD